MPDEAPAIPAASTSSHGAGAASSSSRARGKAYLELVQLKSSQGATSGGGEKFEFQFNPKEFSVGKSASWQVNMQPATTDLQYLGASPTTMTIDLFLDASDTGKDVSLQVDKLMDACMPTDASLSAKAPLPMGVKFGWDKVYFVGFLESVKATYTLFKRDGTPIRALVTVSIKEFVTKPARQNPTSGGLATLGSHVVTEGDTLPSIAYKEFGDPQLWRSIAIENCIDDPLRLVAGTKLRIPPSEAAGAGHPRGA